MPRYIFSPSNVTTGGRPARVTLYRNSTTQNRETNLYRVDGSDNLSDPISNGVIVVATDGVVGSFAGPDDVNTLYIATNEGSRTAITAARSIGSEAAGAPLLLINTSGDLPVGTPSGTVVVVKT